MPDVVVVDDHQLLATTVRIALRAAGVDADLIAPCPLPSLLELILAQRPSVVLLDLDLGPDGDSTRLVAPLSAAGIRVVVVTGVADRPRVAAALEQGAVAYRSKTDGIDRLVDTVLAAQRHDGPLDHELRVALLDELRRSRADVARVMAPFTRLTDREQDTLRAICAGLSAREIAALWVVSEATVRTHVRGVLGKLQVGSQLAAVAIALRSGWLDRSAEARSA